MAEPPHPTDETRHDELIQKHVYGDPKRRPHGKAPWFRHTSSSAIGIEIAVAIAGCTLGARWLETNVTHWAPWTSLIGFAVGLGAAIKALVRTARTYQREAKQFEAEQAAAGELSPELELSPEPEPEPESERG